MCVQSNLVQSSNAINKVPEETSWHLDTPASYTVLWTQIQVRKLLRVIKSYLPKKSTLWDVFERELYAADRYIKQYTRAVAIYLYTHLEVTAQWSRPPRLALLGLASTGFSHSHSRMGPKLTALNRELCANTMLCSAFFHSLSYQQHQITARNFIPLILKVRTTHLGQTKYD